jgi:hypothetical protein
MKYFISNLGWIVSVVFGTSLITYVCTNVPLNTINVKPQQLRETYSVKSHENIGCSSNSTLMALSKIIDRTPSRNGHKWRSIICTTVRNELHLREFIIRNLLTGFSHIVIIDDNLVEENQDMDIKMVVDPFVKIGAVTVVPSFRRAHRNILEGSQSAKNIDDFHCINTYGVQADWTALLDADEYISIIRPSFFDPRSISPRTYGGFGCADEITNNFKKWATGSDFYLPSCAMEHVHLLDQYLKNAELQGAPHGKNLCGFEIPWQMLYGEGLVLSHPQNLLMDTFKRRCWQHSAKMLWRVEKGIPVEVPHGTINCSSDSAWIWAHPESYASQDLSLTLFHYYQKTVEEWITKIERPLMPWQRVMTASYEKQECDMEKITISPVFQRIVQIGFVLFELSVMGEYGSSDGMSFDYGRELNPPTEIKFSTFKPYNFKGGYDEKRNEHELYLFFSKKVKGRYELDKDHYKSYHKDFDTSYNYAKKTTEGRWIDALHHFYFAGFLDKSKTCFLHVKTLFDVLGDRYYSTMEELQKRNELAEAIIGDKKHSEECSNFNEKFIFTKWVGTFLQKEEKNGECSRAIDEVEKRFLTLSKCLEVKRECT